MKRKFVLLTLLMCILGGFNLSNLNAETTVTIGNGSGESEKDKFPLYTGYEYSVSQQIYTSDDLEDIAFGSDIKSIAFYVDGAYATESKRSFYIYLKTTTKNNFDSDSDFVEITNNDLVCSVTDKTFNSVGWHTFTFDKSYTYNGGNLLLCVYDYSNTFASGTAFKTNTSNAAKAIYRYNESSTCNPINGVTTDGWGGIINGNSHIQLTFEGGAAQPQTQVIEIGSPATESYYFPTNRAYNYTLTQQVYTNAEIGKTNIDVKSIAFKDNSGVESTRNLEIYMKNTTDDGCSATSKQMNANELCFSGNVTFAANDWTTITFTTPFEYSDGNFLLCVVDKTGNYGDWSNFATYKTSSTNKSFYIYSDNVPYSASSEYTYASTDDKNCIKIGYTESVAVEPAVPTNLTAYAYTYNTVDLSWTDAENAKKYNVYQGNDKIAENVSGTYFQVTGLEAETYYCFTVTAVNGSKESGHSGSACATTPKEPEMCNVVFTLKDNYNGSGDGWNGGFLTVLYNNDQSIEYTLQSGDFVQYTLEILKGSNVHVNYTGSNWPEENALIIAYEDGKELVNEDFDEMSQIMSWEFTVDCTLPVPIVNAVAVGKSAIKLTWDELGGATGYNVYDEDKLDSVLEH